MMVELALASSIPVAAWAAEDDATIATALQVLSDQAAEVSRHR
jgi:hypothetical protein